MRNSALFLGVMATTTSLVSLTAVARAQAPGLYARVRTDRSQYGPSRPVEITLILENEGDRSHRVVVPRDEYDILVRDRRSGRVVWQWSRNRRTQNRPSFNLYPGDRRVNREFWDLRDNDGRKVNPGTYEIEARIYPAQPVTTQIYVLERDDNRGGNGNGRPGDDDRNGGYGRPGNDDRGGSGRPGGDNRGGDNRGGYGGPGNDNRGGSGRPGDYGRPGDSRPGDYGRPGDNRFPGDGRPSDGRPGDNRNPNSGDYGRPADGVSGIAASLSVERGDRVRAGDTVQFRYTIVNRSTQTQTLRFSSGKQMDIEVRRRPEPNARYASGALTVWQLSREMGYTMAMNQFTLAPGESRTFSARWKVGNELAAGVYDVQAYLTPIGASISGIAPATGNVTILR